MILISINRSKHFLLSGKFNNLSGNNLHSLYQKYIYMRILIAIIVCFSIVFVTSVCSEKEPATIVSDAELTKPKTEVEQSVEQDNLYTFDLLKKTVYNKESKPNISISPFSVNMCRCMALNVVKGKTHSEIENTLRISGFSFDEINDYCKTLREELLKIDPSTQLKISNSNWYDQNFPVKSNCGEKGKVGI